MKVILTEKVSALGNVGEIVNVSQGHARNYLIPNGLAVLADNTNQKQVAHHEKCLAKKVAEEKAVATDAKKKIDALTLELSKKVGADGKLFGSVTNTEVAKILAEKGIEIERRLIIIEKAIKSVGTHEVVVKLFSGVEATLKINVVMDEKQAAEMKAKAEAAEKKAAERKAAAAEKKESDEESEESTEEAAEEEKSEE